jgi:hypothetical protein
MSALSESSPESSACREARWSNALHLFGTAADARAAWGGRVALVEAEIDEEEDEEEAPAGVRGAVHSEECVGTGSAAALSAPQ